MLLRHPVVRAALISGCSNAAGDLLCQAIRARTASKEMKVNWQQTMRFGIIGFTLHGPYFYNAYRWLDSRFGRAATLQMAVLKTAVGQVTVFPLYICTFFAAMGLLEGLSPQQCVGKVRQALLPTFVTGCAFWPFANTLNFMLVPPGGRVLFANAAGLIWNAVLSWENSTKGVVAAAGSAAGKQR